MYYISLLRIGQLFIFCFFQNKDYNSRIIKMFLFFLFFSIHLTINTLFFVDETIHEIYIDEGSFNFIYQFPQIIYSSLISIFLNAIIKYLSLSQKIILDLKKEKNMNLLNLKGQDIFKKLKIKFCLFFIFTFILLITFGYYITCFCGIYVNTQIHLIKDTTLSFLLSLIYPFGICLIPGIFRISALRAENNDKNCLYKLSKIIQIIAV